LDVAKLLEEAKACEHKEAYRTIERNSKYRMGVGVRRTPLNVTSFFVEVIICLCPCDGKTDLNFMEKSLSCLKKLKAISYSLTCQDDNCVSCEAIVPAPNLAEELGKVKALMKASFG
jgi:hypothetical protein